MGLSAGSIDRCHKTVRKVDQHGPAEKDENRYVLRNAFDAKTNYHCDALLSANTISIFYSSASEEGGGAGVGGMG